MKKTKITNTMKMTKSRSKQKDIELLRRYISACADVRRLELALEKRRREAIVIRKSIITAGKWGYFAQGSIFEQEVAGNA